MNEMKKAKLYYIKTRKDMKAETIKRRNDLQLNKPSELAIFKAMQEVEKMGADVKLTNAVTLLSKAKELVSDYIDENKEYDSLRFYKCPECGDFISTNIKTPSWLLEQIKVYHLHKTMRIPCRETYQEITKDEFFELMFNQ